MKKVLSIILAVAVLFSLCSLFSFAEEPAAEDPTTVEVLTYEGDPNPGNWLNQFNEDEECFGNSYVSFRTGAPLKAIKFPFATDAETSIAGTASFTKEVHFDGDVVNYILELDKPLAAGQYVFKISQLSSKGSNPEAGHYVVLPDCPMVYMNRHLVFGGTVATEFAFALQFEKTEGVTDYILPLEGPSQEAKFFDDRAVQIVKRVGVGLVYRLATSERRLMAPLKRI